MTDTRVEPLRNYESFQKSLRNFHSWLGPVVSGACDIDFVCERNGQFLFIEAKPYYRGITLGYGQHLLLYRLSKQPNTVVYLIGEGNNDTFYTVDYATPIPPKIVRVKGKPTALWEPGACKAASKDEVRALVERWWEHAKSSQVPRAA